MKKFDDQGRKNKLMDFNRICKYRKIVLLLLKKLIDKYKRHWYNLPYKESILNIHEQ